MILIIVLSIVIISIIFYICLENRSVEKVSMEIKEGTLTKTGATVIILV